MKQLPFLITIISTIFPLFLHAQMSDIYIPVLNIETVDHEMPTRTIVEAPEGCSGISITNNKYVPGRMVMTLKGNTIYDSKEYEKNVSGMRIKIRGNSTGAFLAQSPYKIKLSKKYDLLGRNDDSYKHKEWLLLSMYTWNPTLTYQESNILNITGFIISKIVGKEWTPDYGFVNVILNDEYQGMYYLVEPVSRGDRRVQLDKTGFLIEHDNFWWNEDVYFKTDYQVSNCGYTYKYPDSDDVTEEIQNTIKDYINKTEYAIYNNGDISQYMDLESFAKWMLIHDILGSDDVAGANRFMYRTDDKSLLYMGPTWDYDSAFKSEGWSLIHTNSMFYYPELFKRKDFIAIYLNLWKTIRPTIISDIQSAFNQVSEKYADSFDISMSIHQTKYPGEGKQAFLSQINEVIDKLNERIILLDDLMKQYEDITSIESIIQDRDRHTNDYIDLLGRKYQKQQSINRGLYLYNGKKYLWKNK